MNSISYHSYQFPASEIFSGRNTSFHVNTKLNSLIPFHLNTTLINVFMVVIKMGASWKQLPSALFQFRSMLHDIYVMNCCKSIVGDYYLIQILSRSLTYFDLWSIVVLPWHAFQLYQIIQSGFSNHNFDDSSNIAIVIQPAIHPYRTISITCCENVELIEVEWRIHASAIIPSLFR